MGNSSTSTTHRRMRSLNTISQAGHAARAGDDATPPTARLLQSPDSWSRSSLESADLRDPAGGHAAAWTTSWLERVSHRVWRAGPGQHTLSSPHAFSRGEKEVDARAAVSVFRACLIFLLPSFLQSRWQAQGRRDAGPPAAAARSTAYLDGLRGLAALAVYFFHFSNNLYEQVNYAYGGPDDEGFGPNDSLVQLPILKVLYSGPAAVSIFFIVSGFALSVRPVAHMRAGDGAGLLATLQSTAFRRPLRLYLPCVASTFAVFLASRAGLFDATRFIATDRAVLTGKEKIHLLLEGPFRHQLLEWWQQTSRMVKLWYWGKDEFQGFSNPFDSHLWTIPIESRASWALCLTQLAMCRFRMGVRLAMLAVLAVVAAHNDRWEMILFWGGFALADFNQWLLDRQAAASTAAASSSSATLTSTSSSTSHPPPPPSLFSGRAWHAFLVLNLISGLYLASYPDAGGARTPGYVFLTTLVPEGYSQRRRFWHGVGGMQVVLAVSSHPALARALSSAVPRYLGRISFGLYLTHALVNHTVGYWMLYAMYRATGEWATPAYKAGGFVVALAATLPVAIWVADVFWRLGDRPCVRLAKWLDGVCLSPKARDPLS